MTARNKRAQRGVVLIIVITVLMALIIVAVPFAMNMRAARRTSVAWVQQEQARIAAHGAASYAANILQASSQMHDTSPLYDDEGEFTVRAYTFLASDIGIGGGDIQVEEVTGFPDAGFIRIDDEWIEYGGIDTASTPNKFTGCVREQLNTKKIPHKKYAEVSVAPKGVRWDITVTDEHSRININTLTPDGFAHAMRLPLYEFYTNKVAKSPTELPTLPPTPLSPAAISIRVLNVNDPASAPPIFTDQDMGTVDGFLSIDDEWIAYRAVLGLDDGNNEVTFVGCTRGIRGTMPAQHDGGRTVFIEFPLPVARLTEDLPRPGAMAPGAELDDIDSFTSARGTASLFRNATGWLRIEQEWLTYYRVKPKTAATDISVRGGLRPGTAEVLSRQRLEKDGGPHRAGTPVGVPPYPLPTRIIDPNGLPDAASQANPEIVEVEDATWFPPQGYVNIDGEVIYYSDVRISQRGGGGPLGSNQRVQRDFKTFELVIPKLGRGLRGTEDTKHLPGAPIYPALYVEQFLSQPFDSVEEMRNPTRKAFLEPGTVVDADTTPTPIPLQDDARRGYFPRQRPGRPDGDWNFVAQLGSELMKYTRIDVRNVAGRPVVELVVAERGAFGTSPAVHSPPGVVRYLYTYGAGDVLVDQMENIPPAVFDQIRPHVTIATLPEGPREVPVMLNVTPTPTPTPYAARIYHDGTVPLLPWRAWLFFPDGESRLITQVGLGHVRGGTSVGDGTVSLADVTHFPWSGRAQIGGREWVYYSPSAPTPTPRPPILENAIGVLDHNEGDVVVPDPLYVSWQNAIQWGGDYATALSEYDSATLRMTNPAKVNINTADTEVIMAVAATARGVQSALSIADAAWIAGTVATKRPVVDSIDLLNDILDDSTLGMTYEKKWLFARWFRSAFAIKNKGAFRVEATGTVKGSRRETAASYTTTQILQVPDIVPAQATTPAPIDLDTQDYFVDWASAKNALPDGTSHLAIIGTTTDSAVPPEMVHGLDAAGIPSEDQDGYAAAQPAPIPQENDPATTFLANYGLSLGITADSAPYDADGPTRGRVSAVRDGSLTLPPPTPSADDVFPEGLDCRDKGVAYFTDYRSTTDGHRNIEADGRNATLAPMAIEMWVKPSADWWNEGTRYLFDLYGGPPGPLPSPVPTPALHQNRISLYEETRADGSLRLVLEVADTLPGWNARYEMPIGWPSPSPTPTPTPPPAGLPWEAGKWYYLAAVVAGTEPGEMAILVTDPGADVGLSPLAAYGTYGIYKDDVANPSPGYSYLITDMARYDEYDSGDEITVHGFFEHEPPYVRIGGTSYDVKSISPPPSPPRVVRDWVLTLDRVPSPSPTPTAFNTKVPIGIEVPPVPSSTPSPYFQRPPSSGDDVLLLFHTHSLPTPTPTPTPQLNLNWEVKEILTGRTITDTTPDPDDRDPTKMWVRLDSHGGWTDERLEGKPKLVLDNALSGDMPAKVPGTLDPPYESSFFTVGSDATGGNPGRCIIDDVKISRLNPTANGRTAYAPSRVVPTPSAASPATPDVWVEGAQGWPGPTPLRARSWLLAPNRSGNGARVLFAKSAVPSPTPIPLPSATPYPLDVEGGATPRPGESVTPLSFIDVAIVSGAPTQVGAPPDFLEVPLDHSVSFPGSGFVVRQSPQLSWYGRPSGYGILGHVRPLPLSGEDGFLLWVPAYGAYGTDSGRPGPRDILTEIPIRYWDRFPGFNSALVAGNTYKWVKETAPALVFRARKRMPGGYLEKFTWEYHNPDTGGDATELPSVLQGYVNVYTELFLDGQRVYHSSAGTQLGYYETPLDSATEPWEINCKFDEIEVRAYFDYTGPAVTNNAFTSGACNIAPKIDKFILYLRQPVSTTMVIPGEP